MTTPEQRQRLIEIINAGLVSGLGTPRPGDLCIEAGADRARCLRSRRKDAMTTPEQRQKLIDDIVSSQGLVAAPDRAFAIRVNDALWSSPEARAKALLLLALAQQGTAGTDRGPWVRRVVDGTIRRILPIALRVAAKVHRDEQHSAALEDAAIRCERKGTRVAAYAAVSDARAARAAAYADRDDVLRLAVQIALDAYAAEGRTP